MNRNLNAIELYEVAEEIERQGAGFYRRAAEMINDDAVVKTFKKLAEWEDRHEASFAKMRQKMGEDHPRGCTFNLHDEPLDVRALAGLAGFGLDADTPPVAVFSGQETVPEVLERALQMEQNAIICYTALLDYADNEVCMEELRQIIGEEKQHQKIIQALRREYPAD